MEAKDFSDAYSRSPAQVWDGLSQLIYRIEAGEMQSDRFVSLVLPGIVITGNIALHKQYVRRQIENTEMCLEEGSQLMAEHGEYLQGPQPRMVYMVDAQVCAGGIVHHAPAIKIPIVHVLAWFVRPKPD